MDTTAVLEKYTQDLLNLPLEIRHLVEELRSKDLQLAAARRRHQLRDAQLHRFVRGNGTLHRHPKEEQLAQRIGEDMRLVLKIQKEKVLLANTALFLVLKHMMGFEADVARLERDDLMPELDDEPRRRKLVVRRKRDEKPVRAHSDDPDNALYCFCQRVSFGEMIGCDNDECKYEWFHWSCVGITSPPRDDEVWFCPDCLRERKRRRRL